MINHFHGPHRFLSNFYPSEIVFEGIKYPTVEHAYQAAKTLHHSDKHVISQLATPGKAKRVGKKLELRPDWEQIKLDVMHHLLTLKFSIPDLKQKLLETGDKELIEGNMWGDVFWGFCLKSGAGENMLGKLLMRVRKELCNA